MSAGVFEQYSAYYDLLYGGKDYAAEADYVAAALREAAPSTKSVLEFGSGTGRHGRLLGAAGFSVFGVERSALMVEKAVPGTGSEDGFECQQGDVRTVDLNRKFDAVISLFHVVSYQTSDADVRQTFASAGRHLPSNGIFLFDVWHGPAVRKQEPSVRVRRVKNDAARITRIAEPDHDRGANLVTVNYTILVEPTSGGVPLVFRESHPMRYFFPDEIGQLAAAEGFQVDISEEFLTRRTPSEDTWGVAYRLRRVA